MSKGKLFLTLLVSFMLLSSLALAVKPENPGNGVGSIDNECQEHGFDFGIIKFEWDDNDEEFVPEDPAIPPYVINVDGNNSEANWSASPGVAGVINKQGQDVIIENGGTSGIAYEVDHGISHLTFCDDKEDEVPEFGTIAGLIIALSAGAFIYKRRH